MEQSEAKVAEADAMEEHVAKMFSYVRNADFEGVDTMLDEGVDVEVQDVNGNTPLAVAKLPIAPELLLANSQRVATTVVVSEIDSRTNKPAFLHPLNAISNNSTSAICTCIP